MAKAPSGAQKRKKRKVDDLTARRRRGRWKEAEWRKRYAELGALPKDPQLAHDWCAKMLLVAMAECAADPGPTPEQRREQLGRLGAQASKVLEPSKLAAKLTEYEELIEELKRAASLNRGTGQGARPTPFQ